MEKFQSKSVNRFLSHFDEIEGWLNPNFVDFFFLLDKIQKKKGLKGNLAEIGLHHGKFFILLTLVCGEEELVLGIDCFEQQEYNYDKSGHGNLQILLTNVKRFSERNMKRVRIIKGDSTKMNHNLYISAVNGRFRIFSVDGSHTPKATEVDFANSYKSISEYGVIIIDDYFNHHWPGVSEGVNNFFYKHHPNVEPFFIGFNKIMFAKKKAANIYKKLFMEYEPPLKTARFFGSDTLIYGENDFLTKR